ncbi:MAG TPA: Xaa-Pro peptidase family protein [Sedimentisphaerales bacterium]|nr:Xaa-Pro peptidase family protein [Sedimentisphaerales bacterium]
MNPKLIAKRIKAIRRVLDRKKIRCLLVTKPANVTYMTGFLGDDSWAAIARGRVYLLTDSRYTEQAQKECPSCKIIDRAGPMADAVANLVKKLKSVRTVAVEDSVSMADFEQLKKTVKAVGCATHTILVKGVPPSKRGQDARDTAGIIETVRSVKDESEIATIRSAAAISTKALAQTLPYIKPGVTESELAGMLDFQIRKSGATNSFETIVAFGPNGSRPHHQPGTRKLRKKDAVLIDFGARYKGYCSDITRCFAIGEMSAFYKRVYDVVEQAQAAAIKTIKPGVKITQVDAAAREVIDKSDLPVYGHGTGHGFGLEIHESPFLKPDGKGKLKAGQVITIEPGIYMPGKLGVRIEDDVLVTETGYKILTHKCSHTPVLS